ncbi:hypothetical protein CVT24_007844 [Panaeolus cyanescens]|uniref:DUF6533 domain-containing protein n=1 Tax=Panaeolus cyanescens TaxID=181874 RepID=A0A409WWJ2_9AGAR|nr:hypothetical protein CVT24_007844 [Panaeolus cyanescens]
MYSISHAVETVSAAAAIVMDPALAQSFFDGLQRVQVVTSFHVVAVVVFLWDYFLTFSAEVDLVWNSKWNTMKVLFLVQRYMPFADSVFLVLYLKFSNNMDPLKCQQFTTACSFLMVIGTALSEVILTLRVWAVWRRAKWLTIILPIGFAMFWVPNLVFIHIFGRSLKFITLPWEVTGAQCFLVGADRILYLAYVNLLVWDGDNCPVTLILIAIPGYQIYRDGGGSSLVNTTFRDGAIFYLYLFALSVVNIIVIQALPDGFGNMLTILERCVHSCLTSRVLLHIREHARADPDVPHAPRHWADGITELPRSENTSNFGNDTELVDTSTIIIHRSVVTEKVD